MNFPNAVLWAYFTRKSDEDEGECAATEILQRVTLLAGTGVMGGAFKTFNYDTQGSVAAWYWPKFTVSRACMCKCPASREAVETGAGRRGGLTEAGSEPFPHPHALHLGHDPHSASMFYVSTKHRLPSLPPWHPVDALLTPDPSPAHGILWPGHLKETSSAQ